MALVVLLRNCTDTRSARFCRLISTCTSPVVVLIVTASVPAGVAAGEAEEGDAEEADGGAERVRPVSVAEEADAVAEEVAEAVLAAPRVEELEEVEVEAAAPA